eukprot:CAMPEP_0117649144 /NCGR_PEP_ID=MMETSP0804-20121206/807_1 /TAXON_ID=1074897 /ORGANISM="Tetraselmis astigmatica, Strain CCMP880" /LENGTH=246 /DNA_ID=CAMNT_0005454845 /DNA_START=43 /DNA_END=783 /DNA_ORIENTATION=-
MEEYLAGLISPSRPRLIVVRNPYARLLSAFLDKALCQGRCLEEERLALFKKLPIVNLGKTPKDEKEEFELFVHRLFELYQQRKKYAEHLGIPFDFPINNGHFRPITSMCLWQYGFRYDYVLKMEWTDNWWADFLDFTDMAESAATGWDQKSVHNMAAEGEACFYHPAGMSCSDVPGLRQTCGEERCKVDTQEVQKTGTSAQSKLQQYYTPRLAAMVSAMYAEDLSDLGYPVWDGASDYNEQLTGCN